MNDPEAQSVKRMSDISMLGEQDYFLNNQINSTLLINHFKAV